MIKWNLRGKGVNHEDGRRWKMSSWRYLHLREMRIPWRAKAKVEIGMDRWWRDQRCKASCNSCGSRAQEELCFIVSQTAGSNNFEQTSVVLFEKDHSDWLLFSVSKLCPSICDPMDCNIPGSLVLHCVPEFAQIYVHWVTDAIQPSHPLAPLFPCLQSFPASGSFSNELPLCIR